VAFKARAFVQVAIGVDQSLGEGLPIVRVSVDDAIGVGRQGRYCDCEKESKSQNDMMKAS
jgi:hypothetical protein